MNRPLAFLAAAVAFAAMACQSGPVTSSSTNWYLCETISDCASAPGVAACEAGFCIDAEGRRIAKAAGAGGADTDGGASGGTRASGGTASGGSGTGGAAAAGAGGSAAGGESGASALPSCEDFDALRTCDDDDDCGVAPHMLDCCGSMGVVGIATSELEAFEELETACSLALPACGCAGSPFIEAEDGRLFSAGEAEVEASCVGGLCRSYVALAPCGASLDCGLGEVCRYYDTIVGPTQTSELGCVPNPCLGERLDCSCAADLCELGDGHGRLCFTSDQSLELGEVRCLDQAQ